SCKGLGVEFAKVSEDNLRSQSDGSRTAGMVPGWPTLFDLQVCCRKTTGLQHGQSISLGVEHIDRPTASLDIVRPQTARSIDRCRRTANTTGNAALTFRRIIFIGSRNLEYSHVPKTLVSVALNGCQQARQQRRPHVGHVRCYRICKLQTGRATPKEFCLFLRYERPCYGLQHAASSERALGRATAYLQCCQDAAIDFSKMIDRLRHDLIDAMDAHDLLDKVCLAVNLRAPGRHGNRKTVTITLYLETET